MGWDDLNPINAGRSFINAADDVKDFAVETTVETTVNIVETTQDAKDIAVGTFRMQGSMMRFGLEKTLDFTQERAVDATLFGVRSFNNVRNFFDRIDTTPGASNPPAAQGLDFSETKGASKLAYDAKLGEVYKFPDGKQWTVVDVQENQGFFQSGFRAIALRNGNEVIVAFAGTDPKSPGDIANDIAQGIGFAPAQYRMAAAFAQKWESTVGTDNVKLTGHSLGGGLAAYASIRTGVRATTVNSAPLALTNLGGNPLSGDVRNNPNITHYYVPGEVLTALDISNPLDNRPGNTIAVEGKTSILNPLSTFQNHSLGSVAPDIALPEKVR